MKITGAAILLLASQAAALSFSPFGTKPKVVNNNMSGFAGAIGAPAAPPADLGAQEQPASYQAPPAFSSPNTAPKSYSPFGAKPKAVNNNMSGFAGAIGAGSAPAPAAPAAPAPAQSAAPADYMGALGGGAAKPKPGNYSPFGKRPGGRPKSYSPFGSKPKAVNNSMSGFTPGSAAPSSYAAPAEPAAPAPATSSFAPAAPAPKGGYSPFGKKW